MIKGFSFRTFLNLIGITIRIPGYLIMWRLKRNKAKSSFKRQLIESGVPQDEARLLVRDYPFKFTSFLQMIPRTKPK